MTTIIKKIVSVFLFLALALVLGVALPHQALASASSTSFTVAPISVTYGGTANVTARLHASSTSIVGKTVTFTLGKKLVLATTTDSGGVATLHNFSFYGIDASSTYSTGVKVVFGGDTHYNTSASSTSLVVNKVPLTVTGVTASNKIYDRLLTATINTHGAALVGIINSENIILSTSSATGAFATKTVGNGKTVTVASLSLGGTATTSNYSLTQPTTSANITVKGLNISGASASSRAYNGSTTTPINVLRTSLVGVIAGDTVTYSTSSAVGTFADKNVGAGKTVTITGITLGGADGGNYSFTSTTTKASITTRPITVTAAANTKTYDGLLTAAGTPTVTSGTLAAGDTGTFTETYDNKAVSSSRVLTPAGTIADSLSADMTANYAITFSTISTGVISVKTLVASIIASNKNYNGTAAATISSCSLSGVVGSDDVSCTGGTATFDNANAGTGKTVTAAGLSLTGADAGNYTANSTATTVANIIAGSSGFSNSPTYCSSVVYGDWQSCLNGVQYRNLLSQSPNYCTLTSAQQAARSTTCTSANAPGATVPPNPVVYPSSPSSSVPPTVVTKAKVVTIFASRLNVRNAGSTKGKVVATFKKGQKYTVLAASNGWYKIQIKNGLFGWISASWAK